MSELRRYLAHFRGHHLAIAAAALLLSLAAVLPGATVFVLQRAFDEVLLGGRAELLGGLAVALAVLAGARAAVAIVRTTLSKRVAWAATSRLRQRLHRHLLALELPEQGLGSRLAALTGEVDELQYGVSALVTAARNPLTLVVLAGSAVWMAPRLAPFGLLLVPVVAVGAWWSGARVRRRAEEARARREALGALAADQLGARELLDALDALDRENARFSQADRADRDARIALEVERILPSQITGVLVATGGAALLWLGGRQVLAGTLQPGELMGFALALGLMHRPLSGLAEVWSLWQRSLAALARADAVLALPLPEEPADPIALPSGPVGMEARSLAFGWGEEPVLDGVSLEVRPGEIAVLVGPSGEGKSTLLGLLAGRREPWRGRVLLGGVPLDRLTRADRRAIALVPQVQTLLDRSVADNLRLGAPDATESELWSALERAGGGFVRELDGGLDAPVGEGGGRLSGGERQRICLARALVLRPRVILLDEATNQVDGPTEGAILEDLRQSAGDCAVLMVAHDPATARFADRALALRDGAITPAASGRVVA